MMRARLVLAVLVCAMAASAASAAAPPASASAAPGEWPGWLGPNRDGKSPDTGLLKEWPADGPTLLWKTTDLGHGYSTVSVSGGTIYTTGDAEDRLVLFALDGQGKVKWRSPVDAAWTRDHPGCRSTPVIDGGKVYLVSGNGVVSCSDAATGRPVWSRNMREFGGSVPGWGYAESVLIVGNLAIVTPGGTKCIVALNKQTGAPAWSSSGFNAGAQYGSCLAFNVGGAPLIAQGTSGGLFCVSGLNGNLVFSNDFSAKNTANCPTPAYADGYLFWANGYGKGGICMKLTPAGRRLTADVAWTTSDMDCHHGGYVIEKGYIYGNNGGGWACLDLKSGRKMWEERAVGKGSLCWADGMLYLFGENGGRAALATCASTGLQVKGQVRVEGSGPSWAHPVVVGGRLYLRYDSNLYCFDVKAK